MQASEPFTAPKEQGYHRPKHSPATIMAVFATLAYFQVPLPEWLKMDKKRPLLLRSSEYSDGHRLGYHRMERDRDHGDWCAVTVHDMPSAKVYVTSDVHDYPENAIDLINAYFESKEKSIRSFRVVHDQSATYIYRSIAIHINGIQVEEIRPHRCSIVQFRVDELCVKWMRLQNQRE
jgi:hypothetical protein